MADSEPVNLTTLTVDLLSAYFANNSVESGEISGLIRSTHDALKTIENGEPEAPAEEEFKPAVTVRKSLASKDHIVSLIDGKPYKMLKRHLAGHGLTPAEYRQRYKLSSDYPMVAPTYSESRRTTAARIGLGRKVKASPVETPAPVETRVPEAEPAVKKPKAASKRASPAATVAEAATAVPVPKKTVGRKPRAKPSEADTGAKPSKPAPKRAPPKRKAAPIAGDAS